MREWLLVLVVNSRHLIFKSLSPARREILSRCTAPEEIPALRYPFVSSTAASLSDHFIQLG